ncbi:MAG: hypothetical protein WCA63_05170 [Gallionella sp.]
MVHEISQFDIPDRQLLETNAQPRAGIRSDIGEAKITRTIFGGARIRVVRERDKKLRAWLLAALAVMALAAAAWQGWIALQKSELLVAPPPLSERIRVSAPVFQPEDVAPSATSRSERNKQRTPTQILIDSMTNRRPPAPQQPIGLKSPEQKAAKQDTAQPSITGKPLKASPATNLNSSKDQTDLQQPARMSAAIHSAAPADATPPATQTTANKPAAVAPAAEPMDKEDNPALSSSGNNQPSEPANAKP